MNTVTNTILQTTKDLLPQILATAGIVNPNLASAAAIAPVVLKFLETATTIQSAGYMTEDQLSALFANIGQDLQSTHNKWVSMNQADIAKIPSILANQAG